MKQFVTSCLLIFAFLGLKSQVNSLAISNSDLQHFKFDSVLSTIKEKSDIAIIATSLNPSWGLGFDKFYLIAKINNQWQAYYYRTFKEPINGQLFYIDTLKVPVSTLDSIFLEFKQNNFWSIANQMNICVEDIGQKKADSLYSTLRDASTQQITTFYEGKIVNVKEYYGVYEYEKRCPPNKDRSAFIKGHRALTHLKIYLRK